jgi:protein phosphatase
MNARAPTEDLAVSERAAAASHLDVSIGYSSWTPGEINCDFVGYILPGADTLGTKGIVAAVADGLADSLTGRQASEYSVRQLLNDYYGTADEWEVPRSLDVVLNAVNRWLLSHSARPHAAEPLATTLTTLVLKGRHYHLAHVGHSRAYLSRDGVLRQLTEDHLWRPPSGQRVPRRAMGIDTRLAFDYLSGACAPGDAFLLATEGVWTTLSEAVIARCLDRLASYQLSPEEAALYLVSTARNMDAPLDMTAFVVRIESLPDGEGAERAVSSPASGEATLRPGDRLRGLQVTQRVVGADGEVRYRVRELAGGREWIMSPAHTER